MGGERSGDALDRDAGLRRPPPAIISARNFSPRWKSCSAATSGPTVSKGSWAGAFGPTQFMPTTFKRYAVDFDGDGRRDVVDSIPDVMASTANNLKKDGWVSGQTWGYEVVLPQDFDFLLADRSRQMTLHEWESARHQARRRQAIPASRGPRLSAGAGGRAGPGFLMLQNFRVIMKYNPAEAYALAIGHLADRLRGGAPFVQAWPRDERVLTLTERYEMQQLLARRGFDIGEPGRPVRGPDPGRHLRSSRPRSG